MNLKGLFLPLFFLLGMMVAVTAVQADTWQGNLKSGGVVRIDPTTHKPTVFFGGGSTQLWDGVHEMDDGSVVVVRDGVAVPNEVMFNTWRQEITDTLVKKADQCKKLIHKTCGFQDECIDQSACKQARQLAQLQQDMQTGTASSVEPGCQDALADGKSFPDCKEESAAKPTACRLLAERVCGEQNACGSSVPCDLARQLLDMERTERLGGDDPNQVTESGKQCREAMDNSFFKACLSSD